MYLLVCVCYKFMLLLLISVSRTCVSSFQCRVSDRIVLRCRSQLSNGSLYITRMFQEQQGLKGDYQCVAALDSVGSIVSRTARLRVASKYS